MSDPDAGTAETFVSPFSLEYAYKRSLGPILTQFATGLRDGRILGAVCPDGRVLCPPKEYDPDTGAAVAETLVEVGPGGVVTSWTDGWALIQLDGASTAMLHRIEGPIATGDRVVPRWAEARTGAVTDIASFVAASSGKGNTREAVGGEPITRFKAPTRIDYVVRAGRITQRFLDGILQKKLIGLRCPTCTKVYIPPRGSCPTCAVPCSEAVELSQTGTVTTFSVIRIPFEGQMLEPPYACAHIVLDGADVPLLHIVGDCDPDAVRMGMRVRAVWADPVEPTLASVRYFEPVDEADVDYESYKEHV